MIQMSEVGVSMENGVANRLKSSLGEGRGSERVPCTTGTTLAMSSNDPFVFLMMA